MEIIKSIYDNFKKENDSPKILELYGAIGLGKSYELKQILHCNSISYIEIDLSINNEIPYASLTYALGSTNCNSLKDYFSSSIKKIIDEEKVLYLNNFEAADPDSAILIKNFLQYIINNKINGFIVVESNYSFPCLEKGAISIEFKPPTDEKLRSILKKRIKGNENILNHIISLSERNILRMDVIVKILYYKFNKNYDKKPLILDNGKYEEKNKYITFISLFVDYFISIDKNLQICSKIISGIGNYFYEEPVISAYNTTTNNNISQDSLKQLETIGTIVKHKYTNKDSLLFKNKISFILNDIRETIIGAERIEILKLVEPYLLYLKDLADSEIKFNIFGKNEKIIILQSIINNYDIIDNVLPYCIRLLRIYITSHAYENAVEWSEKLLKYTHYNSSQINHLYNDYFNLFFQGCLLSGHYEKIIKYENIIISPENKCQLAKAYYLQGFPNKALRTLNEIKDCDEYFEVLNLKISIYDWFSDMKQKLNYSKRAYRKANDEQKHAILKKIQLGVDINLSEYSQQIEKTIEYYKTKSKREQAEILFNYGTSMIFILEADVMRIGKEKILESQAMLHEIYDCDIWYCENSLGIYEGLNLNFQEAISHWESIVELSNKIPFCKLTIYLNIISALIKINKCKRAREYLKICENFILEYAGIKFVTRTSPDYIKISKDHPEINLPIQNFLMMKSLYIRKMGGWNLSLQYAKIAAKCSSYDSNNKYLLMKLSNKQVIGENAIRRFYCDQEMYFCPIMFW